jgi:hypothetical protein
MDTELLVEQKDDGLRLLEQLARDGFDVIVGFWLRTSDDGPWHLYIASPSVDEERSTEAYRTLYSSLNKTPSSWVSPSDVKLLNDQNPIAQAAIEVRDRYTSRMATIFRGKRLGSLSIKEAYVYPLKTRPRLSFRVTYYRRGSPNKWTATLKRGELYRSIRAKGAVSYSTAQWEGETTEDVEFATVSVLLEIDPKFDERAILDHPEVGRMMEEQAREMADEMFRSRHPEAEIEHDEGDH